MKKVSKRLLSVLLAVIMVLSIVPMAGINSFADADAEPKGWRSGDYAFRFFTDETVSIYDYFGTDKSVVIPSEINGYKVTDIYDAFLNCSFIENITIPDSITSIESRSFENTAYYNDENNWENGVLYIGDCLIEAKNTLSGDYKIKDGTRLIAECAFEDCSSLTSVTMPDSVKYIDNFVFSGCSSLKNVIISNSVSKLGAFLFDGCSSLKNIVIPDSVTYIGVGSFANCTSLASITIPDSVTSIDFSAFKNTAYYNNESNWEDNKLYIGKHLIYDRNESDKNDEKLSYYVYPDGTAEITRYTGNDKELVIPSEINGIKITDIYNYAFLDCTSLISVTIPKSVTYIGECAFFGCTSLENITIPDSVTNIGVGAFYDTAYYNNESNWDNGVLYIDGHLIEVKDTVSGVYNVKSGTKSIAESAFNYNDSITGVTIPEGVKGIGAYSFQSLEALTSITIPASVTEINYCAFEGCTSLTDVTVLANDIKMYDCGLGYDYFGHLVYDKFGDITIHGYKGSDAEKYAKNNGFTFVPLIEDIAMCRLYNPNSGEHFYTADVSEKDNLVKLGWKYEGIGWNAPETSSTPVYRLYNQNGGEHHYTTDINERNWLISLGWNDEGIGWYSDDAKSVPIYRQYNPNAFANNHNYTPDKSENDWLVGLGWKAEGIGWYGVA